MTPEVERIARGAVARICARGATYPCRYEELLNAARIGIWQADPTWNPRLAAYRSAVDCLRRESPIGWRSYRAGIRLVGAVEPATTETPEFVLLDRERRRRIADEVRGAVERLPARARRVVVERHFENRSLQEIAERMGITTARASSLCAEGWERLRRLIHWRGL
jgi:RNA polymerase sigma factor (sigma-70 family)